MLDTRAPARRRTVAARTAPSPEPPDEPPAFRSSVDPLALVIVLVAFGLRIWHLGFKSLWLDEGISVTFSQGGPPAMFQVLIERDLHPPLYYLVQWAWIQVGGLSETSVRFPAALVGVLLVPLIYRFARGLYPGWPGRATGLLASALAAVSPFLIYYSQEARMYGALAAAGLAATVALRWALEAPHPRPIARWAVYALLLAVPPYLHLFGWMIVALHGSFVVLAVRRYRRRALAWLGAAAVAAALFLPWVGPMARQVTRLRDTPDFWLGALSLWFVAQHAFAAFAVGFGGAFERYAVVLALFVGAFVLGMAVVAWRGLLGGRPGDLLLVLYLVLPTGMLYAIVASNPKFADRYLILVVPPFLVLLARGIVGVAELGARLRHRLAPARLALQATSIALALGVLAISYREGVRVYDDEAYSKEDYRGAVAYLIEHWQTGDAVLLMLDSYQVFDYYSHGRLTRYGLNPTDDLQFAARELNKVVAAGHPRLWVLLWNPDWADPSGSVRAMLDETLERAPLELESFHHLPVRLYSLSGRPSFDARPTPPIAADVRFGDALRLSGLDLGPPTPTQAGSTRPLRLFWDPLRPISDEISVSLRLTRGGHEWWRWDGSPAAASYPTTYWKPGRAVRGGLTIEVPPGTPPGRYDVDLVVYSPATRQTLEAQAAGSGQPSPSYRLGAVEVTRPDQPLESNRLPLPAIGPLDLGGVELVGGETRPERADAGAPIQIGLGWRGGPTPVARERVIELIDAAGKSWPLVSGQPVDDSYPTVGWQPGELVVDRVEAMVPPGAASGPARVVVRLTGGGNGVVGEVGRIELRGRPHVFDRLASGRPMATRVGEFAELVGVDSPSTAARGEALKIALDWHALAETRTSYNVFVHLVDASDRPVAQRDGSPGSGAFPTSGWVAGEYLRDEYSLPVPATLAPGDYRLVVGMYDARSGQRLPVRDPSGAAPADRVVLGAVSVR